MAVEAALSLQDLPPEALLAIAAACAGARPRAALAATCRAARAAVRETDAAGASVAAIPVPTTFVNDEIVRNVVLIQLVRMKARHDRSIATEDEYARAQLEYDDLLLSLRAALNRACDQVLEGLAGPPTFALVSWPLLLLRDGEGEDTRHVVSGTDRYPRAPSFQLVGSEVPSHAIEEAQARPEDPRLRRLGSRRWASTVLEVLLQRFGAQCAVLGAPCDEIELPHTWPGASFGAGDGAPDGLMGEHKEPLIGLLAARLTGGERVTPFVVATNDDHSNVGEGEEEQVGPIDASSLRRIELANRSGGAGLCVLLAGDDPQGSLEELQARLHPETLIAGGVPSTVNATGGNTLARAYIINAPHSAEVGARVISVDEDCVLAGGGGGHDGGDAGGSGGAAADDEGIGAAPRTRCRHEVEPDGLYATAGYKSLCLHISSPRPGAAPRRAVSLSATVSCAAGRGAQVSERVSRLDARVAAEREEAERAARRVSAEDAGSERVAFRGSPGAVLAFGCVGRRVDVDAEALYKNLEASVGGNVMVLHAQGEVSPTILAVPPALACPDACVTVREGAVERGGWAAKAELREGTPTSVPVGYTCVSVVLS